MIKKKQVNKILDVKGLPCPTPTVMVSKALKDMNKGETLKIITNDITTKETIPSLCTSEGYDLIEIKEENGLINYIVVIPS